MCIMKKMFLFIGLAILSMSFVQPAGNDEIVNAFKSADAGKIGTYFDELIDMKLPQKDELKNVGRNQATISLKGFLSENGIKGFEKLSERELGTTMYFTGKFTNDGKGFNVTVMTRQKDGKDVIITLRIN
jgi:hypothetical protein